MLKLRGLYYITHIDNLPSILQNGIFCHRMVEEEKISFTPIYDETIVSSRREKKVTEKSDLWDFVNLYFQPRNAMLYRVRFFSEVNAEDIVIIGLKSTILDKQDIFVTTGNAASPYTEFFSSVQVQKHIKTIREKTDKEWWASEDGILSSLFCKFSSRLYPQWFPSAYIAIL